MNLLITCTHLIRHLDKYVSLLEKEGITFKAHRPDNQQFNSVEMANLLPGFNFIIAGDDEITEEVINKSKSSGLKAIVKWGIGVDNIDKLAAKNNKIPIFNTPNVFGGEVAEQALSLILNLSRGTHIIDSEVRKGNWYKIEGNSIQGKNLGIIGFGSIGQAIALRAKAFGMEINFYDPFIDKENFINQGFTKVQFQQLCQKSDFIVIACSLNKENRHIINKESLSIMERKPYIINVSRGSLIKEVDLVQAIKNKKIKGAGLDVFETEPLPISSELLTLKNCIFGSHNSSNTTESVMRVNDMTIEMIIKLASKNHINQYFMERRVV